MAGSELDLMFTLGYMFFSFLLIAPPVEFVSAGITVQNIFANYLGSEEMHFIDYHIKRTTVTLISHSILPLGKYLEIHS